MQKAHVAKINIKILNHRRFIFGMGLISNIFIQNFVLNNIQNIDLRVFNKLMDDL